MTIMPTAIPRIIPSLNPNLLEKLLQHAEPVTTGSVYSFKKLSTEQGIDTTKDPISLSNVFKTLYDWQEQFKHSSVDTLAKHWISYLLDTGSTKQDVLTAYLRTLKPFLHSKWNDYSEEFRLLLTTVYEVELNHIKALFDNNNPRFVTYMEEHFFKVIGPWMAHHGFRDSTTKYYIESLHQGTYYLLHDFLPGHRNNVVSFDAPGTLEVHKDEMEFDNQALSIEDALRPWQLTKFSQLPEEEIADIALKCYRAISTKLLTLYTSQYVCTITQITINGLIEKSLIQWPTHCSKVILTNDVELVKKWRKLGQNTNLLLTTLQLTNQLAESVTTLQASPTVKSIILNVERPEYAKFSLVLNH